MAVLSDITVETKISSEFFSPKTFLDNGKKMNSVFLQDNFQLSKSLAMKYKYAVQKVETSFSNRLLYNDQLLTQVLDDKGQNTIINYDL